MELQLTFSYPGPNRSLTDGIEKLQSARRCIEAIQKVRTRKGRHRRDVGQPTSRLFS
jgi:hypothetical protein